MQGLTTRHALAASGTRPPLRGYTSKILILLKVRNGAAQRRAGKLDPLAADDRHRGSIAVFLKEISCLTSESSRAAAGGELDTLAPG
jgi:hypothetical protein